MTAAHESPPMVSQPSSGETDIAIIAMTGRFPGAPGVDTLWENLLAGKESISFFSPEELVAAGVEDALRKNPRYVAARGLVEGIEDFDAGFFGFNPREAEIMDPQQRLFLECAWEALEASGHAGERARGRVGVYASAYLSTYLLRNVYPQRGTLRELGPALIHQGNVSDQLATRVAYKLGLTGPALTVQTACSSSLVAVHLACQALLVGECDLALAGGVSLVVPQRAGYLHEVGGIVSPDGHVRAFDARAQGTVFSDGAGVVVLKRLADALAQGDEIHAVIKGSAINNDGSAKVGFTAPSVEGQAEVISSALAMAGLEPGDIGYVETHGTGTELGDAIEVQALQRVLGGSRRPGGCVLGSVKTNLGHLDNAAGVTGLIKAARIVGEGRIPGTLHFETPNSKLGLEQGPFQVFSSARDWPSQGEPRRAGVSAFGVGGTNAHVVVEQPPAREASVPSIRSHRLLVLSAKTPSALDAATEQLTGFLAKRPEVPLDDVAYTLAAGRRAFAHRRVLVCRDMADAAAALRGGPSSRRVISAHLEGSAAEVVFLFPGQGAQHPGMTRVLYETEPVFRAEVDRCAGLLRPLLDDVDLRQVLYPAPGTPTDALHQTAFTQPALFVTEYALARLWMHWGVQPRAMAGHSLGEYVAACLCGVWTLPAALALVATRGRMMQALARGAMLAVPLAEAELRPLLGPSLSLAAVNAPRLCVASGPDADISALEQKLRGQGLSPRRLSTSHAQHSAMVEPMLRDFEHEVRKAAPAVPQLPFVSSLTGTWITAGQATDPAYWAQHLRQTVRFADCVATLAAREDAVLVEVGPGTTLTALVRQQPRPLRSFASLPHPQEPRAESEQLLETLGQLWLAGVPLRWEAFYEAERRQCVSLPAYPFERSRHWVESVEGDAPVQGRAEDVAEWFHVPSWRQGAPLEGLERVLPAHKRFWLLFSDGSPLSRELALCLERHGQAVTLVTPGEQFQRLGRDAFVIQPSSRADHEQLLQELRALARTPSHVLHLWNTGAPRGAEGVAPEELSFYGLLFLGQALASHGVTHSLELTVVSTGVQEITGEEGLVPERAMLLGPIKVLPQELANVFCRSVDVVPPQGDAAAAALATRVISEALLGGKEAPRVALRGRHRWLEGFEPLRLPALEEGASRWEPGWTYLITGGLGGLGLTLAEALAERGPVRLALVGRGGLPPRDAWDAWLASHAERDPVTERLRRVMRLEARGAEVLVLAADVTQEEALRAAVKQVHARFGRIHGVIHAAGVAGGGLLPTRSREEAAAVLAPKVYGTRVLEQVLGSDPPALWVLCSSTASVLGGIGQVDYTAANAFLDAFARRRRAAGAWTVSVNWDTWREVGMAVAAEWPEALRALNDERLRDGISPAEGARAFTRLLGSPAPQVVVTPRPLTAMLKRFSGAALLEYVKRLQTRQPLRERLPLAQAFVPPSSDVEIRVAEIFQQMLGVQRVGVNDDFFEMGGHSLLATQVVSRLRDLFDVDLPVLALFEGRTVAQVSLAIEELVLEQAEQS
ncbi:type I polyketide synthase [Stigmatella hybrida]|uniref:type I polyketide synthase n=1 Tax=Stigmatella hybrida TaxID=394097 RepID=UPI001CDA8463|nr:type I polyketide synthase [Stigmatella hybrida]